MSFQMYICPILWRGDITNGVQPDLQKIKALMEMPPFNIKKELQAFLGIIIYLRKLSASTVTVCEPLQKLTSSRAVWTWNTSYQDTYDKTKSLIKADACMEFYDETKSLYLETDASGIGLGAALIQTRDGSSCLKDSIPNNTILQPIVFTSKSLTCAECRYSNIENEALGILHGLKNFIIIVLLGM